MIYGYARVSSVGQSLDVQLDHLSQHKIDHVYQEKVSASTMDRPELNKIMSIIDTDDVLVVTRLDRLARSTKDLLNIVDELNKRGASLWVLNMNLETKSATGKLMLTMLGAIATFERELMLERQRDGIEAAKLAGKYANRPAPARQHSAKVLQMVAAGRHKQDIAAEMGIGVASVYRICRGAA